MRMSSARSASSAPTAVSAMATLVSRKVQSLKTAGAARPSGVIG